jgi:hypothetical protein
LLYLPAEALETFKLTMGETFMKGGRTQSPDPFKAELAITLIAAILMIFGTLFTLKIT